MPRLTRTQKYAELRQQLANDSEHSLHTNDLSDYEERLNKLQGFSTNSISINAQENEVNINDEVVETPLYGNPGLINEDSYSNDQPKSVDVVEEVVEEESKPIVDEGFNDVPTFNIPSFEDFKIDIPEQEQPIVEVPEDVEAPKFEEPVIEEPVIEEPVVEEPVVEQQVIEPEITEPEVVEPVIEETSSFEEYSLEDNPVDSLMNDITDAFNEIVVEDNKEEPSNQEQQIDEPFNPESLFEDIFESDNKEEQESVEPEVEEVNQDYDQAAVEDIYVPEEPEEVVEEVKEEVQEVLEPSEPEVLNEPEQVQENVEVAEFVEPEEVKEEVYDVQESIKEETLESENIIDSVKQEIDSLTNSIIDELRHPGNNDDIIDSIKKDINQEIEEKVEESSDEEFSNTVSLEITKIMDGLASIDDSIKKEEPKPEVKEEVKPKVIEELQAVENKEPDGIEIKNIKEMDFVPENTMSDTIPFIVENKEVDIDEEEEEGSNVVLNVILIVLIVVLIAVLALIVYYILKTKGVL